MKKIITLMMVLVMVVALAVPALAADDGVTKDEQDLLSYFNDIVDKWAKGHPNYSTQADQYKAMARATLMKAELDAAACSDLKATIDEVDKYIAGHVPSSEAEIDGFVNEVVKMVNATSTKYKIVVAVNKNSEFSQVWVDDVPVVISNPNPSNPSNPVVPQTGFNMTGTIVVAVVLAVALLGSAVIISKKRLAANN